MRIDKAAMVRLIRVEPGFSEMFMGHVLGRTIRVEEDLVDQLFNSSEKRLARLLRLLANFGKDEKPDPVIAKISQETLAEMIGTTRARVSFFMNKFRKSIASMVMIEARNHKTSEGKAVLERVSHRIDALGQLYAKLSKSDAVEAVDSATYLHDLCRELVASTQRDGTSIELETDIESELLPTDQAIPMGLIVNELVTNALKYAFPNDTNGTVMVALKRASGELRLTVADNGQGVDARRADSGLGGRLVDGFAAQLRGRIERQSSSKGTTVRLIVPSQERLAPALVAMSTNAL
jgi:two-component sensor histidine kinase